MTILGIVTALVMMSSAGSNSSLVSECTGCHFEVRSQPSSRLSNGFGRWKDAHCYGCHQEIDEISRHHQYGIHDPRYFTLPVTDQRLKMMDKYPLPYLNAPLNLSAPEVKRFSKLGLMQYLKRPLGRCKQGEDCLASTMMAYPTVTLSDINKLGFTFGTSVKDGQAGTHAQGKIRYQAMCASCHEQSNKSKYSPAYLAMFSIERIASYKHEEQAINQTVTRLSQIELEQLAAYFQFTRLQKEQALDSEIAEIAKAYKQLPQKPLKEKERQYLWTSFWRDGGCVHCHGIEGRAKQRFDTSKTGVEKYLSSNRGYSIYLRLNLKALEQKHGIGAPIPGMPMTGNALPPAIIQLIGRWLKSGCENQQGIKLC